MGLTLLGVSSVSSIPINSKESSTDVDTCSSSGNSFGKTLITHKTGRMVEMIKSYRILQTIVEIYFNMKLLKCSFLSGQTIG